MPVAALAITLLLDAAPLAAWAGAFATLLVATIALLAGFGVFEIVQGARLRVTFEPREPWCRIVCRDGIERLWVRVRVESRGAKAAHGCVGRVTRVSTQGEPRRDLDPIQLRWAGFPLSRGFAAIDLARDEQEFLNVLVLEKGLQWSLVTFEDEDFEPGFSTELEPDRRHEVDVAVFGDNVRTASRTLTIEAGDGDLDVRIH
jgi:hypothetical protein